MGQFIFGLFIGLFIAALMRANDPPCVVAYCGHISPDWHESAQEAERIFIEAGVECLFMFEGA